MAVNTDEASFAHPPLISCCAAWVLPLTCTSAGLWPQGVGDACPRLSGWVCYNCNGPYKEKGVGESEKERRPQEQRSQ